jgi:hypothetical protein
VSSQIQIMVYDPLWPEVFRRETDPSQDPAWAAEPYKSSISGRRRCQALLPNPSSISFSVADSSDEPAYVPILAAHTGTQLARAPHV